MGMAVPTLGAMLAPLRSARTMSVHTSDPGETGANEVAQRQPVAWSEPSDGTITSTIDVVFDVPARTTVSYVGYWNGPRFLGARGFPPVTFTRRGTWTLPAGDVRESVV